MNTRKQFFFMMIGLAVLFFPKLCQGQNVQKTMEEVFGNDYKGYQWLSYPINDFGVGTAYKGNRDRIDRRGFLCATFTCLGTPIPKEPQQWLHLGTPPDAYADAGCGGLLDAKVMQKKDTVINAILPQVLSVIGITFNASKSGNSTAELKSVSMCARQLQQQKMLDYVNGLANDQHGMKRALSQGKLVLVVGDIVVKAMSIHIKADSALKIGIDGKLQGRAEKVLGEGANFGVKVSRTGDSEYSLTVKEPVIIGLLAVRERTLGAGSPEREGGDSPWSGWYPVTIPSPTRQQGGVK
jgi:hypothetical protein